MRNLSDFFNVLKKIMKVSQRNRTAGVIIIGDELLKGHTKDENASFLLNKLWSNGINVQKVSFIQDKVKEIALEVKTFSEKYDIVITAGGIGPTHDDLTYEGVALALKEPLIFNKELQNMVSSYSSQKQSSGIDSENKTFLLPKSANLIIGVDPSTERPADYPLVCVKNIYIFPGVPSYLQKSFLINQPIFSSDIKFFLIKVYLSADEETIKDALDNIDKQYPSVSVGSYPVLHKAYDVKVTLESEEAEILQKAYKNLLEILPNNLVVSVKECLPNARNESTEIYKTIEPKYIQPTCKRTYLSVYYYFLIVPFLLLNICF